MTFYVEENLESECAFEFDLTELGKKIIEKVCEMEQCPYEVQVQLTLTDDDEIKELNHTHRNVDKITDVLSFPNVDYTKPSNFENVDRHKEMYLDLDTNELFLGDIIIDVMQMKRQAVLYGHSERREISFLIAHSMLHLFGYDHESESQEKVMFEKQEQVLNALSILR